MVTSNSWLSVGNERKKMVVFVNMKKMISIWKHVSYNAFYGGPKDSAEGSFIESRAHDVTNFWLGTLLMDISEDIYHMNGLLSIDGMDERFVFQTMCEASYFVVVIHHLKNLVICVRGAEMREMTDVLS
ncbi:COBW domain-containing protein 1, partial [Tanacetum coccineum]